MIVAVEDVIVAVEDVIVAVLCAGLDAQLRAELNVHSAAEHRFTAQGNCLEVDDVDDAAELTATLAALRGIGVSTADERAIIQLLAGILHIGDVDFHASKDGSALMAEEVERYVCRALGLESALMREALCHRKIKAGLETLQVPKSQAEAQASRDAVARTLYTKLFDWLLLQINRCLAASKQSAGTSGPRTGSSKGFIGLLDIFGFEIMAQNGCGPWL